MTTNPITPADREAVIARLKQHGCGHGDDAGTHYCEIRDGQWDGFYLADDSDPETLAAYAALDAEWRARNPAEAALWP